MGEEFRIQKSGDRIDKAKGKSSKEKGFLDRIYKDFVGALRH